jgi:hypothetical protein
MVIAVQKLKAFCTRSTRAFCRLHRRSWCETHANEAALDGDLTPPYDELPLEYQFRLPMIEAHGLIVTHNLGSSVTHAQS